MRAGSARTVRGRRIAVDRGDGRGGASKTSDREHERDDREHDGPGAARWAHANLPQTSAPPFCPRWSQAKRPGVLAREQAEDGGFEQTAGVPRSRTAVEAAHRAA